MKPSVPREVTVEWSEGLCLERRRASCVGYWLMSFGAHSGMIADIAMWIATVWPHVPRNRKRVVSF